MSYSNLMVAWEALQQVLWVLTGLAHQQLTQQGQRLCHPQLHSEPLIPLDLPDKAHHCFCVQFLLLHVTGRKRIADETGAIWQDLWQSKVAFAVSQLRLQSFMPPTARVIVLAAS